MFFRVALIIFAINTTSYSDVFIHINKSCDYKPEMNLVTETFNRDFKREKTFWFKHADAGIITYAQAEDKLRECEELFDEVKLYCKPIQQNFIFFPAYSLYKHQDGMPLNGYYNIDGEHKVFEIPSEVLRFVRLQNELLKLYDFHHTPSLLSIYGDMQNRAVQVKTQTASETYSKIQHKYNPIGQFATVLTFRVQFKVIKFHDSLHLLHNFPKKELLERSIFRYGKDTETVIYNDYKVLNLKYITYLHNNSFLDFNFEINELKDRIKKEHENVQDSE